MRRMTSMLRVWGMRQRAMARWTIGLLGGLVILGAQAQMTAPAAEAPPQLARGWIVKLKESQPKPVVRLAAAAVPSDGPASQRSRLWQAAMRQRVGMLAHKPTAFGAQVVHTGRLLTVAEAEAEAKRLRQDPDVEWVIVNAIERRSSFTGFPGGQPNDPEYPSQVWLNASSVPASTRGVANFPGAWSRMATWFSATGTSYSRALSPVAVAVLDTGTIDALTAGTYQRVGPHPELAGRLYPGFDFVSEFEYARDGNGIDSDPNDPGDGLTRYEKERNRLIYPSDCEPSDSSWHGFSIINMLAARSDNASHGAGMLAPVPGEVVVPVRVGSVCGADRSDIIEGMLWAAGVTYQGSPPANPNPVRVISLSYSGSGSCEATGYAGAVQTLRQRGVLLVASAGNGDANGLGETSSSVPAACPGVLAVTALHQRGTKATYANFVRTASGDRWGLSVAAGDVAGGFLAEGDAGVRVLSNAGRRDPQAYPSDFKTLQSDVFEMATLAGTSFAAPQVAGVAALMLALDPSLTLDELFALLTQSANASFPVVSGLPACSSLNRGACNCTAFACGSGVLNADRAIERVLERLDGMGAAPQPYVPVAGANSSFMPDRSQSSTGGGGGGGGSMSLFWSAALLTLVAWQAKAARRRAPVNLRTDKR